jgi:CubicO group peptidase (beta-lactamase class C family)
MKTKIMQALMLICILMPASCATIQSTDKSTAQSGYVYKVPPSTGDGWQNASLSDVKMDEGKIAELVNNIRSKPANGNIHGIVIIKNGKLVLEEYFPGNDLELGQVSFNRDELHGCYSVTKSFTSTMVGIAIDKGLIKGTDETLVSLFPEYEKQLSGEKSKIKLKHVLSMTAGFDWDEISYPYKDKRNPYWGMLVTNKADSIGYVLDRPLRNDPGSRFTYNGGLPITLAKLVENKSSMKIKDFADKYLFQPLQITKYEWRCWDGACNLPRADGGLFLRPRDMAKLGYLFLNNGKWNGQQLISPQWIKEATTTYIDETILGGDIGYGYQWWKYSFWLGGDKNVSAFAADGWGGQRIFVIPALDLVVVFTAGMFHNAAPYLITSTMKGYVSSYIISAILPEKNKGMD